MALIIHTKARIIFMTPRHSLRFIRVSLFNSCAPLLLFSAAVCGQISAPNFTPPPEKKPNATPIESQAAQRQAPMSLLRKDITPAQIKEIRLPELTETERSADAQKKKVRIGSLRQMPNSAQKLTDFSPFANPDGTLYLLRIISPQASSLRLHLTGLALPEGATLFAYPRTKPDVFAGPYNRQTTNGRNELWTPSLPGEEVIVELFIPVNIKLAALPFRIDAVSHIYRNPRALISAAQSQQPNAEAAGACEQEVPTEWQSKSNAVGLITFVKTDGEYACSGTLLTDVKKTRTPFFLTANHCIGNDQEATSAEIYWFFESGTEPIYAPTRGAKLLVTDQADDYTLLEVAKPPDGVTYSGWTTAPPSIGTTVTSIHHPQADHKRFSVGQIVDEACPAEVAPEFCNFYTKVRWTSGITEPGSSGGGLFVGPSNDARLVGILSGGESACDNVSGVDFFPRFNRMFGAIGYYLMNGELCRYAVTSKEFMYAEQGGTGEFHVVPKVGAAGCPWQAWSNASWITITSPTSGVEDGKITFQVTPNTTGKPRIGAISIVGRNVLIYQFSTVALTTPCAPTKINFDQEITGNVFTATCSSLFDPDELAYRYAIETDAGQAVFVNAVLANAAMRVRIFAADGAVIPLTNSTAYFPNAGTHTIEVARVPDSYQPWGNFSLKVTKSCRYSFSPTRFEIDAWSYLLNSDPSWAKVNVQSNGQSGTNPCGVQATADEPLIDGFYSKQVLAENAYYFYGSENTQTQQRYVVQRLLGQPIIIKQYAKCTNANAPTFTPNQITVPGEASQQKLTVKMAPGAVCSWEVTPSDTYYDGRIDLYPMSQVTIPKHRSYNSGYGTGDGEVLYNVPANQTRAPRRFVMQFKDQAGKEQIIHSITQNGAGPICATTPAQIGNVIEGTLTPTDCAWSSAGNFVDYYQFNALAGEQLAFELIVDPTSEMAINMQGVSIQDTQSKGIIRYPGVGFFDIAHNGSYPIWVTGKPGSYQLKLLGIGPAGCVYNIDRTGETLLPAGTGTYSVSLACNRGDCDWAISSSVDWITFPGGKTGKGSAAIDFALTPNTGAARTATITVAGRSFTIKQDAPCSYFNFKVGAPDKIFVTQKGGDYQYFVETGSTCPAPTVTTTAEWLNVSSAPGVARIGVSPNSGGFRKGTITLLGKDYQILQGGTDAVTTTAADYQRLVSPGSLATIFHQELSYGTAAATQLPLPEFLGNVAVLITANGGRSEYAKLLYVSPPQINFLIPDWVSSTTAKVEIFNYTSNVGSNPFGPYAIGQIQIENIAPNIFTADSTGKGPAAADIQRIRPGQPVAYEPVAATVLDEQGKSMIVARPIKIGDGDEKTYLVLYATGVRKRNATAAVTAQIGDVTVPVEYAGTQGQFVGLDQINILLPPSLRGKGLVNVTVTIDGKATNPVQINLAP